MLNKIILTLNLLTSSLSFAFVITSGPEEATLAATPDSPTVTFLWNGVAPDLEELGEFEGGAYVGLSNEEVMEQILRIALGKWSEVPGAFVQFDLQIDATIKPDSEDQVHSIVTESIDSFSTAAFAVPTSLEGVITDCDITISSASTSAKSLAYTITHELGHCVGLGHPHTNYGAIMGYSRSSKSLKLGSDDMAGIIYLYPDPTYVSEEPKEITCATILGSTNNSLPIALLFLTIPTILFYSSSKETKVKA